MDDRLRPVLLALVAGAMGACSALGDGDPSDASLEAGKANGTGATASTDGLTSTDGDLVSGGGTSSSPPIKNSGSGGHFAAGAASGTGGYSGSEVPSTSVAGQGGASPDFVPVGTNPFVVVAHDPLSTFAADVDTASYDYFRTYAQSTLLPPAESVRLEEFVNYFSYDYTPPAADAVEPFSLHLAAAPNLVSRDTTVLRVGIQGKAIPPAEIQPANLVFLVDVSGSMSTQLPMVQEVLRETVDLLSENDTIAIVTYASNPGTLLSATKVSEKDKILAAIAGLVSGGSTNGSGGIQAAYAEAESAFIEDGINHILICTDGDFNVGVTTTDALEQLIIEKRKTGITLTMLGFGFGSANDAMMERISNAGNGIYGFIGSADDVSPYVKQRMLQTLVQIAKDMKIQVEFNPEYVYAYRLLGYENRAIADVDFRNDIIDAGEIGSGHRVTALYELVWDPDGLPSEGPAPTDGSEFGGAVEIAPDDLVLVKVRYKTPGAAETDPALEVSASLTPDEVASSFAGAGSDLQWAVAIASFAELLKESPYADPSALAALTLVIDAQAAQDAERGQFAELFHKVKDLLP